MRNLIKKLKEYWNIWGSLVISIFWAWWNRFSEQTMNKTTTFLTMTLMFVGLLTFIKSRFRYDSKMSICKNCELNFGEKLVEGTHSYKSINIAMNPEKEFSKIEKIVEFIIRKGIEFMQKIKNFFKWCITYWQQLLGYISALGTLAIYVYLLIQDKFGFILQYVPDTTGWQIGVKIAIGIIVVLLTILVIRNQSVWKGIGTLETATELLNQKSEELKSQLSPDALAQAKEILKTYKSKLKEIETKISKLETEKEKYATQIKSVLELKKLGIEETTQDYYNTLIQAKSNLESQIAEEKTNKEKINEKISKLEKVL